MAQEKITIQFQPKGDKQLLLAIQKLAGAQAKLDKTTAAAQNEMKKMGLSSVFATTHLRNMGKETNRAASAFSTIRSKMLLASFAASLVAGSIGRLARSYGEQEAAEAKLASQLGRTSQSLLDFASAQQQVTRFGDELTITAMASAAAFTDNEDQIKRITLAAMDYATLMGKDLNVAVMDVSKSIFTNNKLIERQVGALDGVAGSATRFESAMEGVSRVAGGLAKTDGATMLGVLDQMNNAVGDLGESLGKFLAPVVIQTSNAIKALVEHFDVPKINSYAIAVGGVVVSYSLLSKAGWAAASATLALTKAMAKNLFFLGAAVVLGEVIDHFIDWDKEVDRLEKDLQKLNKTSKDGAEDNAMQETRKLEFIKRSSKAEQEAYEKRRQLQILEGVYSGDATEKWKSDVQQRMDAETAYASWLRTSKLKEHISREEFDALEKESTLKMSELSLEKFWFQKKQIEARIGLISDGMNALGDILSLNDKNAKHIARIQAVSAGVSAFSAAQSSFEQTAKILPPPAPQIAYGITLAAGLAQAAKVWSEANKMEQGGYIGGRRHSEGGTMIEAERGEFVMRRSAVEAIGLENLNKMNRTGSTAGTVNITFSGNVISDDFIEDVAIPKIKDAIRRGADLGVG